MIENGIKYRMKKFVFYTLFLFIVLISLFNCGVALTPKLTAKLPPETETEVFRLDVFHGEVKNLYGINLGIVNIIKDRLIGAQIGLLNSADSKNRKKNIGLQVGILNNSDSNYYGLKLGIFNQSEGGFTIQTGAVNQVESKGKGNGGIQLGFYNEVTLKQSGNQIMGDGTYFTAGVYNYGGGGVKIGLFNSSPRGIGLSVGVINTGKEDNFLIGILNFCEHGFPSVMIGFNYCWNLSFMR
ncbi:LA_2272/LA_2273 family lipoprotein [Leptospira weilii]|uniref:LA_2272/LA_2273 family lipoprotein n=1 Tax=Leptospira weilii TaxID=28184 RepID=UPI0009B7BF95